MLFRKSPVAMLTLVLAAAQALGGESRSTPRIVVNASYPGANAQVVADTVAAPIEQQVNGALGVLQLASRCGNDGSYVLEITLKPGAHLDLTLVLAQNRVALALPVLPDLVQRGGVTVRKQGPVLMLVNLSAPTGKHDTVFLGNYAMISIRDELCRLPGVGAVSTHGMREYSMRAWLDPDKLAALKLSAADVIEAIRQQNIQVAAGQIGQPPTPKGKERELLFGTVGRLSDPKEFADIIIRTDKGGAIIRLKDIAGRVEFGPAFSDNARFNGKPGVLLPVYPTGTTGPAKVSKAVGDRLAVLRERLPDGVKLDIVFDFSANLETPRQPTTPEYLLIDLELPANASAQRIGAELCSAKSCCVR